ncbi:hypothetical protein THAOC_32162 [Thalassiosira oceanica]|uniref:Uncharacterized protein n=1 Tax=Thalassiosira oceanica TaxID=159749 RepID=K0R7Q1_THAOC|nr:hypothetical protein THAOC_32162 [Thalassiosira oceanica]|eukprot:EJK49000.1 hypothetical protein THAOC_32162 [Thalassiosira oceanica]
MFVSVGGLRPHERRMRSVLPEAVRAEGMSARELDRIGPLAQADAALIHAYLEWVCRKTGSSAGSAFRTAASAWSTPAPEPSLTSPYPCPRPPTPHDLASEWARATGPSSYHRQSPPYSTPHATPTLSSSDALTDSAHTSPTMPARTLLPSPQETNTSASTRPQRAPSTDSSTTAAPFEYASSTRPPRPTSSTTCPAFCNRRPPTQ